MGGSGVNLMTDDRNSIIIVGEVENQRGRDRAYLATEETLGILESLLLDCQHDTQALL